MMWGVTVQVVWPRPPISSWESGARLLCEVWGCGGAYVLSRSESSSYSLQDGSNHSCVSPQSQPDHIPTPPSHCEGVSVCV